MKRLLGCLAAVAALVPGVPAALAGSGASCSISPSPIEANQDGTLSAAGLPAADPMTLATSFTYNGRPFSYGEEPITVNPDGTYLKAFNWSLSGKLTFAFEDEATATVVCTDSVRVK